jgi:hypothetical protein
MCPARHVGGDVGRPRAALRAAPGQATLHRSWAEQAARTVHMGGFGLWTVF